MTFYKAVRPDGTDFHTGTVRWAPEKGEIPADGIVVTHPTSTEWGEDHSTHLCASDEPTDCEGFEWPCRLLEVEPVGEVYHHKRSKWSALSWRVVRELPATQALGPQGEAVAALVDGLGRLDTTQLVALDAARDAAGDSVLLYFARDAARIAARFASRVAAQDAAWDAATDTAAWVAVLDAAGDTTDALVVWDLITSDHRDILTTPIRTTLPEVWADVIAHLPLTS